MHDTWRYGDYENKNIMNFPSTIHYQNLVFSCYLAPMRNYGKSWDLPGSVKGYVIARVGLI